jgi:hypothetical protein
MKKNKITIAAMILYGYIMNNPTHNTTVEEMKNMVITGTNKELGTTNTTFTDHEWQKIARWTVKKCVNTLYPNGFTNLQNFCIDNPEICTWLYTTCGEIENIDYSYNFFVYHFMCCTTRQWILTGKNLRWTKEETINYLTNKVNEFFLNANTNITIPTNYVFDYMYNDIVTETTANIKCQTPETLEKTYNETNNTTKTWSEINEELDVWIVDYYKNHITNCRINNPQVVIPKHEYETTTA